LVHRTFPFLILIVVTDLVDSVDLHLGHRRPTDLGERRRGKASFEEVGDGLKADSKPESDQARSLVS